MPPAPAWSTLPLRTRHLNTVAPGATGPVVYWMSREIRSRDNWALLYAQQLAEERQAGLYVVYNMAVGYLGGGLRQHVFKTGGLKVVHENLGKLGIPFYVEAAGDFERVLVKKCRELGCAVLVTDFCPLKINDKWVEGVKKECGQTLAFHQVDAHNVVPAWLASDKCEFAARTIRPKLHKQLLKFLTPFPAVKKMDAKRYSDTDRWCSTLSSSVGSSSAAASSSAAPAANKKPVSSADIPSFYKRLEELGQQQLGGEVPPITWLEAGEDAGSTVLKEFVETKIRHYADLRNDPGRDPSALSDLSPYFHYGFVAPQRAVYEVYFNTAAEVKADRDAFVEEAFVRRELAENFCLYEKNYDNCKGFHNWAQTTIGEHAKDKRKYTYTQKQFENGQTHDNLWNAAQWEMRKTGKMHGYIRMYWAKKLVEWTPSAADALKIAIFLNDKWELDGRDPNGYVGCAWSVGGVHDRAWEERLVFGKIRYMSYDGCKGKFDVPGYVRKWLPDHSKLTDYERKEKRAKVAAGKAAAPKAGGKAAGAASSSSKAGVQKNFAKAKAKSAAAGGGGGNKRKNDGGEQGSAGTKKAKK